jgi:hypothetical protein
MAPHRRETYLHGVEGYRVLPLAFFLRIFGFGLWLGRPPAAGLAQFFFVQRREHVMVFLSRSRAFLLTMELLEVKIIVGFVQFLFNAGSHSAVGLARFYLSCGCRHACLKFAFVGLAQIFC